MGDLSREPSMEEILSSIRRVIARDEAGRAGTTVPAVGGRRKAAIDLDTARPSDPFEGTDLELDETPAAPTHGGDDDVLELTESFADDGVAGGAVHGVDDGFADLVEEAAASLDASQSGAPMPAESQENAEVMARNSSTKVSAAVAPAARTAPLASPEPVAATRQSLDVLAAAVAAVHPAAAVDTAQGPTVAALADAALRPMLREWLDANLPTMVEKLVAAEIARITGSTTRD